MHDLNPPSAAALENRTARRRMVLWAVLLTALVLVAGAARADAGASGGIGGSGGTSGADDGAEQVIGAGIPGCPNRQFGRRTLRLGDCGGDVQTLNWILKSRRYRQAPLAGEFEPTTAEAVRSFQGDAGLGVDGVVDDYTAAALVAGMPAQPATWYGPGFFGNQTACGETLTRGTLGVAHRTLRCGSKVVLRYRGRYVRTTVIDRGPFTNGAKWDLTQATARQLGFTHTDEIRVAKLAAR